MQKYLLLIMLLGVFACTEESPVEAPIVPVLDTAVVLQDTLPLPDTLAVVVEEEVAISHLEQVCIDAGLVRIRDIDSSIQFDLRYTTTNNFLGIDLYEDFSEGYLQPDVAEKLAMAQRALQKKDSTLSIVVFDAVRPRSVQQRMWDTLDMPIQEKVKFVSNPKNGSLHNYGAAVDVSIINAKGNLLDMGTPYDHIGKLAWPSLEKAHLDSGTITQEVIDNRNLLRRSMRKGGFWNIQTEWWHFNACRRDTAIKYYTIIE